MKKLILFLILGIFIFNLIGGVSAEGTFGSFMQSTFGQKPTSDYVTSYLSFSSEESGMFSDFSSARMSSLDVSMCRDGTDFLLQVEPLSCTPAVVRSDLLEEQDVPVFCKIQAMKINPLIDVSYIQNINFGSFNNSKGIRNIKFYPKFSALWRNKLANDFSDPLEYQDLGYAVIVLKRTPNESAMPEFVEGKLKVEMKYNLKEAFGIRDNVFYLPEMEDDVWERNRERYSFWNGKGYLRAESTNEDSAIIGLYTDKYQTTLGDRKERDKVKYASFNLKLGEETNAIYLPGVDCLATLTMKLDALEVPATHAIIRVNSEYFHVKQGEKFLDGACNVQNLKINGLLQEVKVSCKGDKKSELFTLSSYPRVDIEVNGTVKNVTVGEKLISVRNKDGATIGAIYLSKMELKKSGLSGENASDMKLTLAYLETNADRLSFEEMKKNKGTVSLFLKTSGKLRDIDFTFNGLAQGNVDSLDETIEESYSSANNDFDSIISNFYEDVAPFNLKEKLSESSYVEKVSLARYLGKTTDLKLICDKFKSAYPDSEKYYNSCEIGINSANSGNAYKEMLIEGDMKDIVLMQIYEPTYEEYGAEVHIKKLGDSTGKTFYLSKGKSENFSLSAEGISYIELKDGLSLNSASVQLSIPSMRRMGMGSNYTTTYSTPTIKLIQGEIVSSNGYEFILVDVNLKKQAKVSLKAGANRATSESNFSYKIGIEKRAIKLSPEKTEERIVKLNKTIEEWTKVNEGLGKVVQVMKGACYATGGILTLKNLMENLDGKAIARQKVMKTPGGWNEKCADYKNMDESYVSVEDCLFSESDKIDAQVNLYDDAIKAQNEDYKKVQSENMISSSLLDGQVVNQTAFANKISSDVGNRIKNTNLVLNGTNGLPNFTLSRDVNINSSEYGKYYSLEDLRNIDLYSRILAQNPNDEVAKKNLYNEIYELNKNQNAFRQVDNLASKYGLKAANVKIESKDLSKQEITEKNIFADTGLSLSSLNLERTGNEIKNDDSVFIYAINSKEYLIKYDNDGRVTGTYLIDNGALKPHGIANAADSNNPFNLIVSLQTRDKLQNSYLRPEVRYYEEGTYKGLPSIVPVDIKDGWYAYMDEGAYLPGQLQTYYESGTVNSFWLCNVGQNRIEEFNSISRDDSCTMINLRTSQTEFRVASLDAGEAESLVRDAVSSIRTASQLYKNGISNLNLGGRINSKINVGAPEVNIPDVRCTDIMSPKECQILFNVCDPVLCPPSRCDFGGAYPVKDVIQSGIVGSLVLCAPNAQEGIIAPICLTGIQAGMDNWLTITKSYQDCLQTSLDTGETVGICDEVRSIYLCEFFWRQAAPLTNMALPKIISALTGQAKRGGGEYMTFNSAWDNFQNSYKYFTNFYASNSFKAFKLRSSEEVGGLLCKSYASVAYPSAAGLLDVLTQPDSPPQYTAKFDEIPLTTATNPPTSHYKVFYHIFAGKDRGAYFRVYLREGPTSSYYQDLQTGRLVASGYISKGEYKTETVDFTYPSGYKELCVNVNGQEECGFGEATTSFAYNYLEDAYIKEQTTSFNITSEKDCVSGTASWYSLLNPNLQEGINDLIDPQIYNEGIVRICANQNPGSNDASANLSSARWKDVGYCGDETMRCWLDTDSLDRVFKFATTYNQSMAAIENDTISKLIKAGGYMSDDEYKALITQLDGTTDLQAKIDLISEKLAKVYQNNKYSYLLLLRGKSYAELAKGAYLQYLKAKEEREIREKAEQAGLDLSLSTDELKLQLIDLGLFDGGEAIISQDERPLVHEESEWVISLNLILKPKSTYIPLCLKYFKNEWHYYPALATVFGCPISESGDLIYLEKLEERGIWTSVTDIRSVEIFDAVTISQDVLGEKKRELVNSLIGKNYVEGLEILSNDLLDEDSHFEVLYTSGKAFENPLPNNIVNYFDVTFFNNGAINMNRKGQTISKGQDPLYFKYEKDKWFWTIEKALDFTTLKVDVGDSRRNSPVDKWIEAPNLKVPSSFSSFFGIVQSHREENEQLIKNLEDKTFSEGLAFMFINPEVYDFLENYFSLSPEYLDMTKYGSVNQVIQVSLQDCNKITNVCTEIPLSESSNEVYTWNLVHSSYLDSSKIHKLYLYGDLDLSQSYKTLLQDKYDFTEYFQNENFTFMVFGTTTFPVRNGKIDVYYSDVLLGTLILSSNGEISGQEIMTFILKNKYKSVGKDVPLATSPTNSETSFSCGQSILNTAIAEIGNDTVRPFAEAKDNPCATFVTKVITTTSCVKNLPDSLTLDNQQCQAINYLISIFQSNPELFLEIEDKTTLQKGDIVIFGLKSKSPDKTQHSSIFAEYNADKSEVKVISDPGQAYNIQAGYYETNGNEWYISYAFRYIGSSPNVINPDVPSNSERTVTVVDKEGNIVTSESNAEVSTPEKTVNVEVGVSRTINQEELILPKDFGVTICDIPKPALTESCVLLPGETIDEKTNFKTEDLFLQQPEITIIIPEQDNFAVRDNLNIYIPEQRITTNSLGELTKINLIPKKIIVVEPTMKKPVSNIQINIKDFAAPCTSDIKEICIKDITVTTNENGEADLPERVENNPSKDDAGSVIIAFSDVVNYAKENLIFIGRLDIKGREVKKSCKCETNCQDYADWIVKYSEMNGIDSLNALALMIQESGCDADAASSSSVGLMQINCKAQGGKYGLSTDIEECKTFLLENPESNIEIGIKILKANYNNYNTKGVLFKSCNRGNFYYYGWDAAFRAYNGAGCVSTDPNQDYFVEDVNNISNNLKSQFPSLASNSDISSEEEILAYSESEYSITEDNNKYYITELSYDCSGSGGITGAIIGDDSSCTLNQNKLAIYLEPYGTADIFVLKADRNFVQNVLGTLARMFQNFEFVSGDPVLGFVSMDKGNIIYDKTDLADSFLTKAVINETKLVREFRYSYEKKKVNAEVLAKVKKASMTDLNNGFKNAHCGCIGDYECTDYAYFLDKYSKRYNVPYMVIFALILQETECNQELVSASGAYGATQIISDTFIDSCGSVIGSFEDIQGSNNLGNNIHCGLRVLKDKYSVFKNGIVESNIYQNNKAFKEIIDSCMSKYPDYVDYSSWQAAYRAYNGFGCGVGSDLEYANKVNGYYNALVNL